MVRQTIVFPRMAVRSVRAESSTSEFAHYDYCHASVAKHFSCTHDGIVAALFQRVAQVREHTAPRTFTNNLEP